MIERYHGSSYCPIDGVVCCSTVVHQPILSLGDGGQRLAWSRDAIVSVHFMSVLYYNVADSKLSGCVFVAAFQIVVAQDEVH